MNLLFEKTQANRYKSASQKARVLTEQWVDSQVYCPNCGQSKMSQYKNNRPVADFYCMNCREDYQLKGNKNLFGKRVVDGAYSTMINSVLDRTNPNLFLLSYELQKLSILNFLVIPKHFFTPDMIEKRNPLSVKAVRAGWTGCNILIESVPESGKIYYIRDGTVEPKIKVLKEWNKTLFLREEKEISAKGWLLHIMMCIERLGESDFLLDDIYGFEEELARLHPNNKHIKDKIRQQLQFLRSKNYLEFKGGGKYRLKS